MSVCLSVCMHVSHDIPMPPAPPLQLMIPTSEIRTEPSPGLLMKAQAALRIATLQEDPQGVQLVLHSRANVMGNDGEQKPICMVKRYMYDIYIHTYIYIQISNINLL